jgi:hypothetical protein
MSIWCPVPQRRNKIKTGAFAGILRIKNVKPVRFKVQSTIQYEVRFSKQNGVSRVINIIPF